MTELLETARRHMALGRPVFPVKVTREGDKRPLLSRGVLTAARWSASTNPTDVDRWPPYTNAIGWAMGGGRVVIDVDTAKGGQRDPAWPDTYTVQTRSGGLHLHYLTDADIRNSEGVLAPAVDVRGAGGYVVAPGSPGYELIDNREPVELPASVAASLAKQGQLGAGLAALPAAPLTAGRANFLIDAGRRFIRGGWTEPGDLEALMWALFDRFCDPGDHDLEHWRGEVERFADDAAGSEMAERERRRAEDEANDALIAEPAGAYERWMRSR